MATIVQNVAASAATAPVPTAAIDAYRGFVTFLMMAEALRLRLGRAPGQILGAMATIVQNVAASATPVSFPTAAATRNIAIDAYRGFVTFLMMAEAPRLRLGRAPGQILGAMATIVQNVAASATTAPIAAATIQASGPRD
jgi:hypothetical protein